jgi:threonine dehydratase
MIEQIHEAAQRLAEYLQPTPLVRSKVLNAGASSVYLKLESLQPTGAFKVRPALNGMLCHLDRARQNGVVTSSSGNFAQAVAWAAKTLGVDAQIVMMESASAFKRERTRAFGGTVVLCGNTFQDRWDTTFRIQRESGRVLLHPYDSVETIAGDGTVGIELLEQIQGDFCVAVPISGGGLISGIASAIKSQRPACRVVGVQPTANGSMALSLSQGERVTVSPKPSLADALVVASPGERTFAIARDLVDEVVLVEEPELAEAVRILAIEQKIVAEPGGAAGVAALLAGKIDTHGLDLVCVISGGNVLPSTLAEILAGRSA